MSDEAFEELEELIKRLEDDRYGCYDSQADASEAAAHEQAEILRDVRSAVVALGRIILKENT